MPRLRANHGYGVVSGLPEGRGHYRGHRHRLRIGRSVAGCGPSAAIKNRTRKGEEMDYRYLGKSGVKVSPIRLGTMMFGGATDGRRRWRIIDKAREQGIDFIDTADVYNRGKSEEVVGRGHRGQARSLDHRHEVRPIAWAPGPTERAVAQVDVPGRRGQPAGGSVPTTSTCSTSTAPCSGPLEEPLRAVARPDPGRASCAIRASPISGVGVSRRSAGIADLLGIDRPIASQPLYNIVDRRPKPSSFPRQTITVSVSYPTARWRVAY